MLKIDIFLGNQILRILSLKVVKNKQIRCEICLFYSFAAVAAFFFSCKASLAILKGTTTKIQLQHKLQYKKQME